MTDIHLFGRPISVSEFWLFVVIIGGAILWSGNELRRAATLGKIGFKGRDYSKDDDRFMYRFYIGFWSFIFASSLVGAIAWYFDLGMEP